MPAELLASACEEAGRSKSPVREAALLRIARVETAFDRDRARQTFERALCETRRVSGLDGELLLERARLMAAAVAPDLLSGIHCSGGRTPPRFAAEEPLPIMLEHGHGDAAFEYVTGHREASTFPYGTVPALMQWLGDEERKRAVFRCAIEAWRTSRDERFISLFQWQWTALPPDEAWALAREIVQVALERPDEPASAEYGVGSENRIVFTSRRELTLFEILHVLRYFDGPLAESLIAGHPQLAAAARRFPNGIESLREEAEGHQGQLGLSCGGGYIMGGRPEDFPYLEALIRASEDGDFGPAVEHALERYGRDAAADSPNRAPRDWWASTARFRTILYRAGKRLGRGAAVYLDHIPDRDLRLFAQIELAAALAGLPEWREAWREYYPR